MNTEIQVMTETYIPGEREEHSGSVLAGRLESLESVVTGLTSEDGGRLARLEEQVRTLNQAIQSNDDYDLKLRRQRR